MKGPVSVYPSLINSCLGLGSNKVGSDCRVSARIVQGGALKIVPLYNEFQIETVDLRLHCQVHGLGQICLPIGLRDCFFFQTGDLHELSLRLTTFQVASNRARTYLQFSQSLI